MSSNTNLSRDLLMLECCFPNTRQPYIGVDVACQKNAIFCIQHNCHINNQGLIHQMLPLKQFKRKLDEKKIQMQIKVRQITETFSTFIDRLIQEIRQIKIKKCLQLSMLWLRDLSNNEQEYELMKKIYRLDFQNVSCRDVQSIYYKIIHNKQLYGKQISQIKCYSGIYKILNDLGENKRMVQLLAQKLTQIQGILSNGQLIKNILPDRKLINQNLKEVLLQQKNGNGQNFQINYNKSVITRSSKTFKQFTSKYPIIPHLTYHVHAKTKYSNIMIGICSEEIKLNQNLSDIHYNENVILYNCANGSIYKQGLFVSGSNAAIRNLNELNIKVRITDQQIFVMTNKCVLGRSPLKHLKKPLFLLFLARTEGDSFEIHCDNQLSSDNVKVLQLIKQQHNNTQSIKNLQQNQYNQQKTMNKRNYQVKNQPLQNYPSQKKLEQRQEQYLRKDQGSNKKQNLNVSQNERAFLANTLGKVQNLNLAKIQNKNQMKNYNYNYNDQSKEASQLSKIRESFKNLKNNVKQSQDQQKNKQFLKQQQNWLEQKNKYLTNIKQKMRTIRQSNFPKKQEKMELKVNKQSQRIAKLKSQQSNASNIKINLSEEGSAQEFKQKVSLLSGIRKKSDDFYEIKIRDDSHMGQSIQPSEMTYLNMSKDYINKIKTPPKMNAFQKKFLMNQQQDF